MWLLVYRGDNIYLNICDETRRNTALTIVFLAMKGWLCQYERYVVCSCIGACNGAKRNI